jgi:molybdopterin synthase catalytic subunit
MEEKIDVGALVQFANRQKSTNAGSMIIFTGRVRDFGGDHVEVKLPRNSENKLNDLVDLAIKKFNLVDALVYHRGGNLKVGEVVAFYCVISCHRSEGFEACMWLVDRVKELFKLIEIR